MGECVKSARAIFIGLLLITFFVGAIGFFIWFVTKPDPPDYESYLENEELHKLVRRPLSSDIKPLHYILDLDLSSKWNTNDDENHFQGNSKILVNIGNISTKYIVIDSRGLNVYKVKIFKYKGETKSSTLKPQPSKREAHDALQEIPLRRWFLYPPSSRMVIETIENLTTNSLFVLETSFVGQVLTPEKASHESGLLKLKFGDKYALTTTGSDKYGGQHSRRIFPCFDDTRFPSTFSLKVRHNDLFTPVTSVELKAKKSNNPSTSVFHTTTPQATRYFVLVVAQFHPDPRNQSDPSNRVFFVDKDNYNTRVVEILSENLKDAYEDLGRSNFISKYIVFPNKTLDPEITSAGITSVSLPLPEENIRITSFGSLLRMKGENDTWIEAGFQNFTKMDEELDPLADDFAYRRINWNNMDLKKKDRQLIESKAKSVFKLIDKDSSENTFKEVMKLLLQRRQDEDDDRRDLLSELDNNSVAHCKTEDEQSKGLFEIWKMHGVNEFNSTTLEEFMSEVEKVSSGSVNILNSWMNSPDYPVINVEFLKGFMKVVQKGFHHPYSNYTWVFPLELRESKKVEWITKSESFIPHSGDQEIVNQYRKVYGRVNYAKDHWNKLFQSFNEIPADVQVCLINDIFSLAWYGHIEYDVVLDSLVHLETINHWKAGKTLEAKIRQIDFVLKDSQLWENWKEFVKRLTGKVYQQSREYSDTGLTRLACMHDDMLCLKDAYDLYRYGNNTLLRNQGLKEMSLFKHGHRGYFQVDSLSLEAAQLAKGFSIKDLNRHLKKVSEERFHKDSFMILHSKLAAYFEIQHNLWDWFRYNIREIQKIFSKEEVAKMFEVSVEHFNSRTYIDDARHVWSAGDIHTDERDNRMIQHKMNVNYLWMDRNQKNIRDWLKNHLDQ